jgi:hypothetical protein
MIFNNWDWHPSSAFCRRGRFRTTFRKFNIWETRAAAGFALPVGFVSEDAS